MNQPITNHSSSIRRHVFQVMFTILALKVWQPTGVGMNRGNHEAEAWHSLAVQGRLGESSPWLMAQKWCNCVIDVWIYLIWLRDV